MQILVVIMCLVSWPVFATGMNSDNDTVLHGNSSNSNKDMYVINAMVYQVGIVTNRTDNETANMNTTGNQEAFTFFKNNGSKVDLSQIPDPLVTNVTAQSVVGVAPVSSSQSNPLNQLPWSTFSQLTNKASPQTLEQGSKPSNKFVREVDSNYEDSTESSINNIYKRFFKRDISKGITPVEMRKGVAFIPPTAGVQSIAIPTLLTLNNNMSQIPVPIPNTSVVHYAKINTLVTSPST